jgi:hypothetical protein
MQLRDDFTEETRRVLRDRVGGLCSRPECRRLTVSPNEQEQGRVDVTGRAAHITAASKGGPRYDGTLTREQRRSASNGIWLCGDCADLVDKNQGKGFSADQLRSWKRTTEERQLVQARLRARLRRPTWLDQISTPHYVNCPRLLNLVGDDVISDAALDSLKDGFPRGRAIIRELGEVSSALRLLTLRAIDVRDVTNPESQLAEGLPIYFYQACRTKNSSSENPIDVKNYSFEKSPLLYTKSNGYRYVLPYDPIWLTTSTAHGTMRQGNLRLAGIGIIKAVSHSKSEAIATPLALGIPNPFF